MNVNSELLIEVLSTEISFNLLNLHDSEFSKNTYDFFKKELQLLNNNDLMLLADNLLN